MHRLQQLLQVLDLLGNKLVQHRIGPSLLRPSRGSFDQLLDPFLQFLKARKAQLFSVADNGGFAHPSFFSQFGNGEKRYLTWIFHQVAGNLLLALGEI